MKELNTKAVAPKTPKTPKARKTTKVARKSPVVLVSKASRISEEITGDHAFKQLEGAVSAFILDTVKKTELTDINDSVNKCHLSGKGKGTMLLTEDNTIAVSLSGLENATWVDSAAGAVLAPIGTLTPVVTTIGDRPRKHKRVPIASHLVPSHPYSDISSAASVINQSAISGKQLGAIITDDTGHIFMASGSAPKDAWKNLTDVSADIIPTGAEPVPTTGILGDKAKSRQSLLSALPLAVVTDVALADATHPINLTAVSGKAKGAAFALDTNIVIALGSEPTDGWVRITNGSTVTPS